MKAIQAYPHRKFNGLALVDLRDPGQPGPISIRVHVHATSLNFYDLGVVTGRLPSIDGRIPMADGAGVVEAVGSKVTEFELGDHLVSTFFPTWLDGEATMADFTTTPGDGIDGFALQIARAMGATVIATSSSDEKLERLRTIGAVYVINYRQDENWGDRVRDLTGGTGVDHVVEVGGDLIRGIDAVHGYPVIDRSFALAEISDAFRL